MIKIVNGNIENSDEAFCAVNKHLIHLAVQLLTQLEKYMPGTVQELYDNINKRKAFL